jgi:2-polyprenyl-3-methyl-5-hydroxy-6-metoxy-1,4-benzoquinol methylase
MAETEKTNTLTLLLLEGATSYHRWIYEQMKPFLRGGILEVGCGIGNLTEWLLQRGKVLATDVNEDYLDILRKKYQDHPNFIGAQIWDIRNDPAETFQHLFDTIVCSNVLEHIEDDDLVLKYYYELLSQGGRLVLLVPALKPIYNHLDRGLGHFRRYGRMELHEKLTRSGFKICDLTYFNIFGILGWFVNGTLFRRQLLPAGQVRMFNRMAPLLMRIEKTLPKWVGQSLIAVGEK